MSQTALKLAYSSNAYMRVEITEAIERIASIGYQGMELMADTPHAFPRDTTDEQIDAIRRKLDQHQLSLSNINAFMMNAVQDFWHPSWIEPDATFRRQRIDHTIQALDLARILGAPSITTEPGGPLEDDMPREKALDLFVSGLQEVLPHAESCSVQLLVEPEPDLLIENADQFIELAERIESPAFGLNFDVGHFYCVSDPLPETIERLKPWTRHYHFEDIAATRVHEHLIPGCGAIDFEKVLQAIQNTEYHGWITVELYPYLDDPDDAGRQARDFLLPHIDS